MHPVRSLLMLRLLGNFKIIRPLKPVYSFDTTNYGNLKNSPLTINHPTSSTINIIIGEPVTNESMDFAGYQRDKRLRVWREIKGKVGLTKKVVGNNFWKPYMERQMRFKRKKGRYI